MENKTQANPLTLTIECWLLERKKGVVMRIQGKLVDGGEDGDSRVGGKCSEKMYSWNPYSVVN